MARKKTILKEDILSTAYEVVRKDGFKGITARNIAKEMDCSTQPIYLEFKNMNELKKHLYQDARSLLCASVFSRSRSGRPVIDTCLNYIEFAQEEKQIFFALYMEGEMPPIETHELAYSHFKEAFKENEFGISLSDDKHHDLFESVWPFVHGTAAMVAQGYLPYDEKNLKEKIMSLIVSVLGCQNPPDTWAKVR